MIITGNLFLGVVGFLAAVIVLLIGGLVYKETVYRKDVKNLLDRLMARSYVEYVAATREQSIREPVSMSDREEYELECKQYGINPEKEEV